MDDSPQVSQQGSESQDSEEPAPPGTLSFEADKFKLLATASQSPISRLRISSKGVENAKKRLRAFSIQKKTPIPPVATAKPISTGNTTVLIGKLSSVKVTPKVERPDDEQKKLPKPPKPGTAKKYLQESYTEQQKKTLSEIEDMKRKMELVELGIPLGLICPSTNEKAMPTKAMPPIKTFLDSAKVDEIIREAKLAKAEGREFKFDYQKFVPDYDNPFQRKKEEPNQDKGESDKKDDPPRRLGKGDRDIDKDRRKSGRYDRRHDYKDERDKYRNKDKSKERDKNEDRSREREKKDKDDKKDREEKHRAKEKYRDTDDKSREREVRKNYDKTEKSPKKDSKEANVNLSDYLVCDSWSLENEDKNNSPHVEDKVSKNSSSSGDGKLTKDSIDIFKENLMRPKATKNKSVKMERLKPVMDSFKFEIDPNDDEILDIFDEESDLEKYATATKRDSYYDSPGKYGFKDVKDTSMDGINDDTFLESVINEIKQENMSDGESQDNEGGNGLVEYDMSPKDEKSKEPNVGSITPELDDKVKDPKSQTDYTSGYRSTDSRKSGESGYRSDDYKSVSSTDSGYKHSQDFRMSMEKDLEEVEMSKSTVDSLETWSFVLKICQPLLFRHDKNKCYKETRVAPKLWFTTNPKACNCVEDRAVVYCELDACKMALVDRVYGCDQIPDAPYPQSRQWYPRLGQCITETPVNLAPDAKDDWVPLCPAPPPAPKARSQRRSMTPERSEEVFLDREYQRFMQAVWPEATEAKAPSRSTTPVRQEARKKKKEEKELEKKEAKKIKLSSERWSQESDIANPEEETVKSVKLKVEKVKEKLRKRKLSSSTLSSTSESEVEAKKRKKSTKKKANKKLKSKAAKRRRLEKKVLKKLKERKRKKKEEESELDEELIKENKKRDKRSKKKKQQKLKKQKSEKKKLKVKDSSSSSDSSSTSSTSSSDTDSSEDRKARKAKKKEKESKKKKEKKRRKRSTSESQSDELFDVNVLNNIKTERLTDDEKTHKKLEDFSPRKHSEIINVKELQDDFTSTVKVKQEAEEEQKRAEKVDINRFELNDNFDVSSGFGEASGTSGTEVTEASEATKASKATKASEAIAGSEATEVRKATQPSEASGVSDEAVVKQASVVSAVKDFDEFDLEKPEPFKEPPLPAPQVPPEDSNLSQCSSQESQESVTSKEQVYEKDDSHLRPSSQNSNYCFNDVIASHEYKGHLESAGYQKGLEEEEKFEGYEQGNYEMYEQLAMAYQSDVASQQSVAQWWAGREAAEGGEAGRAPGPRRIETLVRARSRGEIKCDWRAGEADLPHAAPHQRPSRWGLKPGEVNIVLTGGAEPPSEPEPAPVFRIPSLAKRADAGPNAYDEAYMDMYGASDRLQYGDCFAETPPAAPPAEPLAQLLAEPSEARGSLDSRIDQVLRTSVLSEVAPESADKDTPEKGILVTKRVGARKRVVFADGYRPGQDSDTERPPHRKKKRLTGCAWPCPASHPDHVPLWDALPPPPPPPGSPPPPAPSAPPLHLLRRPPRPQGHPLHPLPPPPIRGKYDPSAVPAFMPPEPPPGLISFP